MRITVLLFPRVSAAKLLREVVHLQVLTPPMNERRNMICSSLVSRVVELCTGGKAVSIVLGTGVGGLLAQPALNFPNIFSGAGVLGK